MIFKLIPVLLITFTVTAGFSAELPKFPVIYNLAGNSEINLLETKDFRNECKEFLFELSTKTNNLTNLYASEINKPYLISFVMQKDGKITNAMIHSKETPDSLMILRLTRQIQKWQFDSSVPMDIKIIQYFDFANPSASVQSTMTGLMVGMVAVICAIILIIAVGN